MGSKLILLSKKIKNFVFFKIPSFKIDNILGGSCPHLWVCNPPTRKWPKFFLDERPLYEHCEWHCDLCKWSLIAGVLETGGQLPPTNAEN